MSISVRIIGANQNSEEYKASVVLSNIIKREMPSNVFGEIVIHANATLFGQTIKDIDILMMGVIQGYKPKLSFFDDNNNLVCEPVHINSFCTAIELKSHGVDGILREGAELYVKYKDGPHPVTKQSEEQKISVMNFFKNSFNGYSPYVTNAIWFNEITASELNQILTIEDGPIPTNALSGECTLKSIMQVLLWQRKPYRYRMEYYFDSNYSGYSVDDFRKSLELFSLAKSAMGELTRKRVEQIRTKSVRALVKNDNKYTIMRGRAGSGKTIGLINCAISIADEQDARVLLLTYNKALVSDIRRLLALADLPDLFNESCVSISTIQSYLFRIVNNTLYNGNLGGEYFIENYDAYINELAEFLVSDEESKALLLQTIKDDINLAWDYCFIDEAQDCSVEERNVLRALFPKEHLMIADGGNQYVRNIDACDWSDIVDRKNIKLKYCLRQKNNIIKFNNSIIDKIGHSDKSFLGNGQLLGGSVKLVYKANPFDVIGCEIKKLKSAGNCLYDLMIFVTPSMVEKQDGALVCKNEFDNRGIGIWEGTRSKVRSEYPIMCEDARVLQYESGRGLEAWTVVCLNFDEFLDNKINQYDGMGKIDSLVLESEEEKKLKYLINWVLIPLTRAIDTLVITFKNPQSRIAREFAMIAESYPDFIELL